ncbi:MAG: ion transporter [Gammaproteobacteria bacterium]|nr:ion transporter [Gammaproteobacteria bacterium]
MNGISLARQAVFEALFNVEGKSRFAKQLDSFITWLIVANLLALVLEHIPAWYATHEASFGLFDRISIYIFTAEFVLRLFAAGGDPRYSGRRFPTLRFAVTPFALIDVAVIAPYWLHLLGVIDLDLRALRALRLLRLLKLLRDFVPAVHEFRHANAGRTLRQKVYALMNDTPTSGRLHHQLDLIFILFIITSVLAVFLETITAVYVPLAREFHGFDMVAIGVFTVEYLLRLYAAPEQEPGNSALAGRFAFVKKPGSLIDLIAIAPFYLQFIIALDLRFLRILRVLRVLKLTRYNTALTTFAMVLKREKRAFTAAMFITVLITILSGAIVYEFEHAVQPEKFDTMPRAMYWAVITLASVGYGDISPVTPIGQAFTMVLAILGIGIVALPAGILGSAFSDQLHQQREEMLKAVEDAFADGILTEAEERQLEEERIRLHLSEAQFEKLKQRAMARHSVELTAAHTIIKASEEIAKLREALHALPVDAAILEIDKLNLPDAEKAALRVLLK